MSGFGGANPTEQFTKFWSDMMANAGKLGMVPPPQSPDEAMKHMRRAFFDAWAAQCDEYMRSEQFLDTMKKSMDNALAFKQQMKEFFTKHLHDAQMPARSDTDSILLVLRSLEERVLAKLEDLAERVERLETASASKGAKKSSGT